MLHCIQICCGACIHDDLC